MADTAEKIYPQVIEDEMKSAYLDYAMSVIIGRALPDVKDGFKPVHRRILFAMKELGNTHDKPTKKCARIVGETLGKFHPHGDMAVYDALVRMAQNFSLRYPLIEGQGNFGCFTADTKVKLTDGRDVSFIELVHEHALGKRNFTYTVDEDGSIKIAEIRNPRKTKEHAEVMKVVLDNSEEIKCTLNHRFLLKNGRYKEAKDLQPADSLMPAYFRQSTKTDDPNAVDYAMILQPKTSSWGFVHHLADLWNLENRVYRRSAGRIRHHADFNKLNNDPDNIQRMDWKQHWQLHYQFTSERHKHDPAYREKLAKGREAFWLDGKNRKKYSQRMRERNLRNWKNEKYREQMRVFLSEVNKKYLREHPERIVVFSKRATKTLQRLWKTPAYRKLIHEKIVNSNKRRTTNLTGKKKFLNVCSYLKQNDMKITKENFEKVRKEVFGGRCFTTWDLGYKKYFQEDPSFVLCELEGNHKVSSVEFVQEYADVYDLTIEKTHNFALAAGVFVHNSVDGDSPAHMRYTEARLAKISDDVLQDIDKETVEFTPNFDGTLQEPLMLPSKIPNLLVNGSTGIAVGMATNIPPHNLKEVCAAIIRLIEKPDLDVEELMTIIKGPDFPTGAIISGKQGIREAYTTGRGKVIVTSRLEEERKKDKVSLVIKEIPYQINKSQLVEEIADNIREKKIEGVSDLRDESDREGIRIVLDLKQSANVEIVKNQLLKNTRTRDTFGIIFLCLVENEPRVLPLKSILVEFLHFRQRVVRKRTEFELKKAEERAHVLEGLIVCIDNIDAIINLLKKSKAAPEAKQALMQQYSLSEVQSQAVLDMRLQRLTGLERDKIRQEHKDLLELIKKLMSILADEARILEIIKQEMQDLIQRYGDARRTMIGEAHAELDVEDLIVSEDQVVTLSNLGYIKRMPLQAYRVQSRGGKGVIGTTPDENDFIERVFIANTHSYLLCFTDQGMVYWLKVYKIPEASRYSKGKAIVNLVELDEGEKISSVIAVTEFKPSFYLVMATKNGIIKKTEVTAYSNPRAGGIKAITLEMHDALIDVKLTDDSKYIVLATKRGVAVKFQDKSVRPIGRTAKGVIGVRLEKDDEVVGLMNASDDEKILTITEHGYGKKTELSEYRLTHRGGKGVINIQCSERNGNVVAIMPVTDQDELICMSKNGIAIRIPSAGISTIGRNTQGVRIMKLEEGDRVVSVTKIANGKDQT